ncbi:MAG: hypothetical protein K0B09_13170 [Bacteroidales bacterium]|nr:hypothetical protein [Bacteroidales bacterium]
MKSFLFIFLLNCLLVFFACNEKETADYRDKFLGQWNFEVVVYSFTAGNPPETTSETRNHTGLISYGPAENEIAIQYLPNNSIILVVSDDGQLNNFPTFYCHGSFSAADSLQLYLRWGGLNTWFSHAIEGFKK